MRLEAWSGSDTGLVRKNNQDTAGCFPELGLFIVADGMGGRAEGEVASGIAVETLRAMFAADDEATETPGLWRSVLGRSEVSVTPAPPDLRAAVERANLRVFNAGQRQTSAGRAHHNSMGTTVVALRCDLGAARAVWAHVGDSRLYRVRAGTVALLTADHTLLGEPYWHSDAIPIDLPHTNRLVRALGITSSVDVSVGGDALRPGDLFLLCSDGVSGMIAPDELRAALLADGALAPLGLDLISRALAGGGRDNASAVLLRVLDD